MKIYLFDWGIYPRRLLVYLAEKGLTSIETINVDPMFGQNKMDWFLKINPGGTLPVLQTDSGILIRETISIIDYLEELYPTPDMSGATPEARAVTRDLASLVNVAYAFGNTYVAQLSPLFGPNGHQAGRVTQSDGAAIAMGAEFKRQLSTLEGLAGDGDYLGGGTPNVADTAFFASAQFYELFYKLGLPKSCPRLQRICDRFAGRPSAAPPKYPDVLVPQAPVRQDISLD